jgi:hypothetical protein
MRDLQQLSIEIGVRRLLDSETGLTWRGWGSDAMSISSRSVTVPTEGAVRAVAELSSTMPGLGGTRIFPDSMVADTGGPTITWHYFF